MSLNDNLVVDSEGIKCFIRDDVKEAIKELKEEIRWRIKAMNRNEYTPQQTSRSINKAIDEIFGKELVEAEK